MQEPYLSVDAGHKLPAIGLAVPNAFTRESFANPFGRLSKAFGTTGV